MTIFWLLMMWFAVLGAYRTGELIAIGWDQYRRAMAKSWGDR